jgi:hypothetical protein
MKILVSCQAQIHGETGEGVEVIGQQFYCNQFSEHTPECDFYIHKCDVHTHEYYFWTQSVECDLYTQIAIFTRSVRFLHAECNFDTQCNLKCNNDKQKCDFNMD